MAFVGSPYRHDIFVSYSHGDVQGDGRALLKQWSQGFVRELELELRAFFDLGAEIKIFLDQNQRPGQGVDPMAPLTAGLKSEVAASAILAVLMTPQYVGSHWCKQEREWWVEAQRDFGLPHHKRIAVARVWSTGETPWPEHLVDSDGHQYLGHTFFDASNADVRPQPYSWPNVDENTMGPFRDALLDFVGRIRVRLLELKRELDQRREREAERVRLAAADGQVIYLHGRNAHAPVWERVHRELEDDGYTVFPLQPEQVEIDPRKIRETQHERVATMSGCDAVLLLGTDDVPALTADLMVIGRLDRHQAIARSSRSLPCAVVDTVGVVRQKPDWSRKARNLGVNWFDASIPPWTPQIRAWLNGAAS
jgi:hypothetical protein